jgi:hypothetical protein
MRNGLFTRVKIIGDKIEFLYEVERVMRNKIFTIALKTLKIIYMYCFGIEKC